MARKLKTFQTSLGFYDLAVAAPSMKAALEAWGAGSNLFHQGIARETDDPDMVAATMGKPGVVLKRPAGSNGRFAEHSELPTELNDTSKPKKAAPNSRRKPKKTSSSPVDKATERKAALAYEREQKRRDRERAKSEAVRQKERERRQRAVDEAQAALDEAQGKHEKKTAAVQAEVEALREELPGRKIPLGARERAAR